MELKEYKLEFFKKNENSELPSINQTENLIGGIHKTAIASEVNNNEKIRERFLIQARKTVDNELESINQENISRRQRTTYDSNKEACLVYGIDQHVPLWQIYLMRLGSGFWFIIYWIFATLTIAPINIFFKGIKTFIQNNIIVFVMALLCYLIIVIGIPLLVTLIK